MNSTHERFIRFIDEFFKDQDYADVFFHFGRISDSTPEKALAVLADIREVIVSGSSELMEQVMEDTGVFFPDRLEGGFASWPDMQLVLKGIADRMELAMKNASKFKNLQDAWTIAKDLESTLLNEYGRFL